MELRYRPWSICIQRRWINLLSTPTDWLDQSPRSLQWSNRSGCCRTFVTIPRRQSAQRGRGAGGAFRGRAAPTTPPVYTGVNTARGYFQWDPDLRRIFDNLHWLRNNVTADGNTDCTVPEWRGLDPVTEQTARQDIPIDQISSGTLYQEDIQEAHWRGLALRVADTRTQLLDSYFFLVYAITFLLFITYIRFLCAL